MEEEVDGGMEGGAWARVEMRSGMEGGRNGDRAGKSAWMLVD